MNRRIFILFIITFVILFANIRIGANNNEYQLIYEKNKEKFFKMKEFQREYRENKLKALAKIKFKTDWIYHKNFNNFYDKGRNEDLKNTFPEYEKFYYEPDYPGSSFPHFKQKNDYYCGPASALTVLYFQGSAYRVRGNGYIEKQDTIAGEAGTFRGTNYEQGGTFVYKLTNTINNYSSSNYFYDTRLDVYELDDYLLESLRNGNAPIIHSLMEEMPYYRGRRGGHYVTIVYYDWRAPAKENGIEVMDNNLDDEFFGINRISFDNLYNMLQKDRYIIVAPER